MTVSPRRLKRRAAFFLQIRPDRVDDYVAAHANVWPEILEALRVAGFRNYSIFLSGSKAIRCFEVTIPGR